MKKLTKEQAIVISGYTGFMICEKFSDLHADIEARIGQRVFTHELSDPKVNKRVKALYKDDFCAMKPE